MTFERPTIQLDLSGIPALLHQKTLVYATL
jgi:hypothetical protein